MLCKVKIKDNLVDFLWLNLETAAHRHLLGITILIPLFVGSTDRYMCFNFAQDFAPEELHHGI